MARMPRNQLLDILFSAFREQPHWGLKALRERTQQPEAYLKEVLTEIAALARAGEHAGTYALKPNFATGDADAAKAEASLYKVEDVPQGMDEDDEDDEDEDDDMEEVG
jgi:transcription initiation factor TFIIF subunit beta